MTPETTGFTFPTTVYLRKIDMPPGYIAVPVANAADFAKISGGFVYKTAQDAMLGQNPTPLHAGITYPTTVYQKIDVAPGYAAVPVASEAELIALLGTGAVFLTPENALRYLPPPEQPIPHIARTDNFEQFIPGKSTLGAAVAVPVARENPLPGTYVRRGLPDQPPPPDPPLP